MQDTISRQVAEAKLKEIFGFEHFYDEQWRAIERILRGERILMIERTGFGKSLCYQFPATQFDGVTVIFSPLIALMRDQVRSLCKKGISAAYILSIPPERLRKYIPVRQRTAEMITIGATFFLMKRTATATITT